MAVNVCEKFDIKVPCEKKWYFIEPDDEKPESRVGHTATYNDGKVYLVGGATPSGTFDEVWILNLATFKCNLLPTTGYQSVYEHCAIYHDNSILSFFGTDLHGNKDLVQKLDLSTNKWDVIKMMGKVPSARTHHTMSTKDGCLLIFGGGDRVATPVGDSQLYTYDTTNKEWKVLETSGTPPIPRLGHVMAQVGGKIYVHGGMSGQTVFGDLHVLNADMVWEEVCIVGPCERAAHGAQVLHTNIFVFGGLGETEALGDLWKLDTDAMVWTEITTNSNIPPRLDFAMTTIYMTKDDKSEPYLLIHGGVNTFGTFFDEFYTFPLSLII